VPPLCPAADRGRIRAMSVPTDQIITCAAAALVFLLCLPFAGTRKLLLELSGWALRLGILAALAGGGYLWFRPDEVPAWVNRFVDAVPYARDWLPPLGSPAFGLAAAVLAAAPLLPLLAAIDVT